MFYLFYLSLLPILIDFIIRLHRKDEKAIKKYFSYAFLTFAITFTLKPQLVFLSELVSLLIIPLFIYENPYFKNFWLIYALLVGYFTLHNLIQLLLIYALTSIAILAFNYFERKELHRKIVHIGLGCLIGYITLIRPLYGIYFMSLLLIIGSFLYLIRRNYPVSLFLKEYSKDGSGKEAFTLVIGILVSFIIGFLIGINPYFAAYYQAWVDGLSAIFGVKSKGKSLRGFIGGIAGGIIAVLATKTNPLFAIAVPLVEYKVRKVDDNLVVPIITLLLYILVTRI